MVTAFYGGPQVPDGMRMSHIVLNGSYILLPNFSDKQKNTKLTLEGFQIDADNYDGFFSLDISWANMN